MSETEVAREDGGAAMVEVRGEVNDR